MEAKDAISERVADILEECMIKPFEALVPCPRRGRVEDSG